MNVNMHVDEHQCNNCTNAMIFGLSDHKFLSYVVKASFFLKMCLDESLQASIISDHARFTRAREQKCPK